MTRRQWGYWTRFKLELLGEYLDRFTTASTRQREIVYLDAFAGEGSGVDRLTGEEFPGSARIALEVSDPSFTKLRYFERPAQAVALRDGLRRQFPGRDIVVYGGDCNDTIPQSLRDLDAVRWAPTFAFVDPDGMELAWATVEALADHKRGYRSTGKPEYKVELWMLFPSGGLLRTLALDEAKLDVRDEARATRLFGTEAWRSIYQRRATGQIEGADAREEYVNLFRWRLENDLGYARTHPLEIKNERGARLYHMIFATDNAAGDRIMTHLYGRAAGRFEEMRREAIDRRRGQLALDLGVDAFADGDLYEYQPPHRPDQ